MYGIDIAYVDKAIDDLVGVLGVSEEVLDDKVIAHNDTAKPQHIIEAIACQLRLPVRINVSNVPADYHPPATSGSGANTFHSTNLVITDSYGRGRASIVAQVQIPPNLPLFGSSKMEGFPINVKVSTDAHHYPKALASVMAHELAHIVLYSIWHKEKSNEVYTDLSAMLLGFSTIMRDARTNWSHGYLDDNCFSHAYSRINELRRERSQVKTDLLRHSKKIQKTLLHDNEKLLNRFGRLMEHVDNNVHRLSRTKHAKSIVEFHQNGYVEKYSSLIHKTKQKLNRINSYCSDLIHYTPDTYDGLHRLSKEIHAIESHLKANLRLLQHDVHILKEYVGLFRVFWNKL